MANITCARNVTSLVALGDTSGGSTPRSYEGKALFFDAFTQEPLLRARGGGSQAVRLASC